MAERERDTSASFSAMPWKAKTSPPNRKVSPGASDSMKPSSSSPSTRPPRVSGPV